MLGDNDGNLRFTSTSDDTLHELEGLQIEMDEGPCLRAYRTGRLVLATDLRHDERFPKFGPRALDAGMSAVYSFPMSMDERVVGALNLYSSEPGEFTEDQIEVGTTFSDVATMYLVNARDIEKDLLTKQLQHALNSRVVIEQAKGHVAALTGLELPDAFELIRSYARAHQVKVRAIARALHGDIAVQQCALSRRTKGPDTFRSGGFVHAGGGYEWDASADPVNPGPPRHADTGTRELPWTSSGTARSATVGSHLRTTGRSSSSVRRAAARRSGSRGRR